MVGRCKAACTPVRWMTDSDRVKRPPTPQLSSPLGADWTEWHHCMRSCWEAAPCSWYEALTMYLLVTTWRKDGETNKDLAPPMLSKSLIYNSLFSFLNSQMNACLKPVLIWGLTSASPLNTSLCLCQEIWIPSLRMPGQDNLPCSFLTRWQVTAGHFMEQGSLRLSLLNFGKLLDVFNSLF